MVFGVEKVVKKEVFFGVYFSFAKIVLCLSVFFWVFFGLRTLRDPVFWVNGF